MRLLLIGLALTLLSGCVTAGGQDAALSQAGAPAPTQPNARKAVLASTMEVKVDTSAVGGISPAQVGERLALVLATITEYRPDTGTAITPIRSAVALPDASGQMTRTTVYNDNAYRQTMWMDDYDKVQLDRRDVDPGWYLIHSFGSTAGFARDKPRNGQRGCLQYGGAPAPGVTPVALRAGEIGYFGHFVVTIAVEPGSGDGPYALSVADARIDPAPADLDDLLRRDGLDPTYVRRIPADRFPCPWTVPRVATG
ncbi:MAG: hypothetical protein RLO51_23215 [Thalassobaculum sp.]|uniref:hypothetical protein n=1 Tax=Thalassobaculum sp. TaxID=2022740 RepID=UPI0032EF9AFE